MLIECLIQRVGPTPLFLDKVRYLFMPQPFGADGKPVTPGEPTTSVCEISKPEHLEHLLRYPNSFREYKEHQKLPEGTRERPIDLSGYAITKFQEAGKEGYIVEKKSKPFQYCGLDGGWKSGKSGIFPFPTEYEAWSWLKDEVSMQVEEPEANDAPPSLVCPVCNKVCTSAAGYASHVKAHKTE